MGVPVTVAQRLLIVIPALNEEATVGQVVAQARATCPEATLLVVDDGSRDATGAVAAAAGADVLRLPYNLGVGGAMRAGFRFAERNQCDVVVQVDGDGQHDPRDVSALVDALWAANADIVVGARFAGAGDYVASRPRRWAMKMLASVLSRLARTQLTDATSGFRAFGPRAINLYAHEYPSEYLGDTIEALVTGIRRGLVVRQVPVTMAHRAGGRPSQNPVKATIYLGRAMLALLLATLRK